MDPRADFLTNVLPKIEETVISTEPSNERRIKRSKIIEDFFVRIGCNSQGPPSPPSSASQNLLDNVRYRMANPNFSEYPKLVYYQIPPEYIEKYIHNMPSVPERKRSSLGMTCSKYVEDVLVDLLEKARSSADIDKFINLFICPLKVYFQQFTEFITNPAISNSYGINFFTRFMVLTSAIIDKKIEQIEKEMNFSMLEEMPGIIITLLASRHIMCNEWLNKIYRDGGFSGHELYAILRHYFDDTQSLYRRYLIFIQSKTRETKEKIDTSGRNIDHLRELQRSPDLQYQESKQKIEHDIQKNQEIIRIQQAILLILTRMNNELSELNPIVIDSVRLNGEFSRMGEAVTPLRQPHPVFQQPGGARYKRVKRNYSKTKKYKNKFSKTKKYKKFFSKKKKY